MKRHALVPILVILGLTSSPAQAQTIVHDPTSYAKLIEQAKTALDQLRALEAQVQQGKTLLDSLNLTSAAGQLAPDLKRPTVRDVLPDLKTWSEILTGGASALGQRTQALRQAQRLYAAPADSGSNLETTGVQAARNLALAQTVTDAGAQRQAGLVTLQGAIDQATTVRAVLDLQARLASEQTLIANDQMRLQGLAMAQAAEAQLATQQDRERAAQSRAARMAYYRRGFQ